MFTATSPLYFIVGARTGPYHFSMLLRQLCVLCREEFSKVGRAMVAAYELMRAADERVLRTLLMFFQDR
jgi:hypothetical protein